ncbi:MAG: AAA-like domain-containing protein [Synechococcus sp.]
MVEVLANRYEIVKQLGAGGFGQTYIAKDRHLPGNPFCVVKKLKPKEPKVFDLAKRKFDDEAKSLYRLGEHDQIPRLLAHFEESGNFYLVEDYVRGHPLARELVEGEPLSQQAAIALLEDILQVLVFVHSQNAIHRDIKPSNLIRRASDGKIVLIDFGAVKDLQNLGTNGNGASQRSVPIGSPGYTPREQLMGNPHYSSDLYAAGLVCLQALTGLTPNNFPQTPETQEYRCALLKERAVISPGLAAILDKMVRQDYRQRYQTAAEALQAVRDAIARSAEETVFPIPSPNEFCQDDPRGHVALGSAFYLARAELENRCYREIVKRAALIRLKAPLDMGKTSLMVRILDYAQKQGYRTILLSFTQFEESVCSNLNQLLRRFCALVSRELGISPKKINEYWDEEFFGPNVNCSQYFEECLLPKVDGPLVLALDDIDSLFYQHRVAKDFLKLLRYWHEQSKTHSIWSKVRLILAYSTEVYVVMDTNSSPFNVGIEISLPEFTPEQVLDLAHRYGLNWTSEQVDRLMAVIGGHPYLIRVALYHLACQGLNFDQLLETASTDAGLYGNHLRRHLRNLKRHPDLLAAMQTVVTASEPVCLEPEFEFKLNRLGLVNFEGNEVSPRSELYRQYFRERLASRT